MARPIFHIGYHKTATSWFQARVYPGVTSHRYVDRVLARRILLGGNAFDFDPAAARAALGFADEAPPPLVCDEDLCGFMHLGLTSTYVAKAIADRIQAVAPEAEVVIFVRNQPAMIASSYQQYLREGGTGSVRRYLFPDQYDHPGKSRPFKLPGFAFDQYDYAGLIGHYDALFGSERVHVYPYELLAQDREATLARLAADLGIAFGAIGSRKAVNASYRAGLMPLARAANLFTRRSITAKRTLLHVPYWYPARKWLLEQANRLPLFGAPPTPARLLGEEVLGWIAQRFWASNRGLAERMGVDLAALGYPLDPPGRAVARPARPSAFTWMRN